MSRLYLLVVLALLALPVIRPAPVLAEGEVVVDAVRTEAFPRVVVRFTLDLPDGAAPADLAARNVLIAEGGLAQTALDVYRIGRQADERVGTYEAVWLSRSRAEPGQTVSAQLAVTPAGRPERRGDFRYLQPLPTTERTARPADGPTGRGEPSEAAASFSPPQAVPTTPKERVDLPFLGALSGVLAGTAVLAAFGATLWRSHVRRAEDRLATWVAGPAGVRRRAPTVTRNRGQRRSPVVLGAVRALARASARLVTPRQSAKLRHNLVLAGRPTNQQYLEFMAIKCALALALFAVGWWIMLGRAGMPNLVVVPSALGMLGFILPNTWLAKAIKKRQRQIRKKMPDALDLMTIGVSAGLSFDGAVAEVVEKWDDELSREFGVLLGELRMGRGRRGALLALSARTEMEEIRTMVAQLVHSEELGTSLTETLLTLADQMRIKRRQQAEEQAHKAAIKMLIPLVFLTFPALFVAILGPAVPDLLNFIQNGAR